MHCRFFLRSLNLTDRDMNQYSSSLWNKLGLMGVLDDYDGLYEKSLLFCTLSKCIDENAVLIRIQASSPPSLETPDDITIICLNTHYL